MAEPRGPWERFANQVRIVVRFLVLNLEGAMEYRVSFVMNVAFMALNNLMYLGFWWIFFQRFDSVKGWRLSDVAALFALGASSFGIANVVFGNGSKLSRVLAEGGLDAHLLVPGDPLVKVLASRSSVSAVGDILFGLVVFALAERPGPAGLLLFAYLSMLSALVFTAFGVLAHSLVLWTGGLEGPGASLHEAMLSFSIYPETVFSGPVRTVLYTLVPAGFMTYLPLALWREPGVAGLAGYTLVALGFVAVARAVFARGLRRYESGSQVLVNV